MTPDLDPLWWIIAVAAGGALGGLLRHVVYLIIEHRGSSVFPVPTFTVNLVGSFVIGLLIGLYQAHDMDVFWVWVFAGGTCGAFTTFSSFSSDWLRLNREGRKLMGAAYVAMTVVFGIVLAGAGFYLGGTVI